MLTKGQNEKTVLFVMAFFLAAIDKFIPVIPVLPWLKIGLFHAITMVWIFRFGIFDALAFVLIRQWVITAFFGFSFLPFLLGTSGAVLSVILGGILIKSRKFGMIFIGIFCAIIHNITQLFVLYFIMSGNFVWQWQLPIMLYFSLFTGTITGFLAVKINKIYFDFGEIKFCEKKDDSKMNVFGILLLVSVIFATCFFENYYFYAVLLVVILIIAKLINCKLLSAFDFVKRYGIFIFALCFSSTFISVAKISLWFLLTPFFQKFGFYRLFYAFLLKIFPQKYSQTLSIGTIMPQIFPSVLESVPLIVKSVFKNPKSIVDILLKKSRQILVDWEN
jgi:heptaprenyl diphosphate synthase